MKQKLIYENKQLYIDSEANISIGDKEIIDEIKTCSTKVKDVFSVKVGLVTGADKVFNITDNIDSQMKKIILLTC